MEGETVKIIPGDDKIFLSYGKILLLLLLRGTYKMKIILQFNAAVCVCIFISIAATQMDVLDKGV